MFSQAMVLRSRKSTVQLPTNRPPIVSYICPCEISIHLSKLCRKASDVETSDEENRPCFDRHDFFDPHHVLGGESASFLQEPSKWI